MGYTLGSALRRRIEIGVENAGPPAELELESRSLADLKRRLTHTLDEVSGRHADEVASDYRRLHDGRWLYRLGLRRLRCTSGKRHCSGEEKDTTHRIVMAMRRERGKLAARASRS
jgi:hypothetical protein